MFGNKEGFLDSFNQLLTDNIPALDKFYQDIIDTPAEEIRTPANKGKNQVEIPDAIYKSSLCVLHDHYLTKVLPHQAELMEEERQKQLALQMAAAGGSGFILSPLQPNPALVPSALLEHYPSMA